MERGRRGGIVGRLMAAAVLVLGLTGCASQLKPYTDPEQARIDEYERAAQQILRSRGIDGPPPVVRIGSDPALAQAARRSSRSSAAARGRTLALSLPRGRRGRPVQAERAALPAFAPFVPATGSSPSRRSRLRSVFRLMPRSFAALSWLPPHSSSAWRSSGSSTRAMTLR